MNEPTKAIPVFDADEAERKLLPWWGRLDREPSYPATTAECVALLQAVEYDVNHDDLLAFITNGVIGQPPRVSGKLCWGPCDILAAAFACEHRRMWKQFSELHLHKRTLGECVRDLCSERGEPMFRDLADHDIPKLLAMIVDASGGRGEVSILVEAIRHKLREEITSE